MVGGIFDGGDDADEESKNGCGTFVIGDCNRGRFVFFGLSVVVDIVTRGWLISPSVEGDVKELF